MVNVASGYLNKKSIQAQCMYIYLEMFCNFQLEMPWNDICDFGFIIDTVVMKMRHLIILLWHTNKYKCIYCYVYEIMGYRFPEGPTTTYKNQGHPLPAFYAYLAPISLHLEKLRITQEFWDDLIKRHTCIYIVLHVYFAARCRSAYAKT